MVARYPNRLGLIVVTLGHSRQIAKRLVAAGSQLVKAVQFLGAFILQVRSLSETFLFEVSPSA
jgi:hypothetical protein